MLAVLACHEPQDVSKARGGWLILDLGKVNACTLVFGYNHQVLMLQTTNCIAPIYQYLLYNFLCFRIGLFPQDNHIIYQPIIQYLPVFFVLFTAQKSQRYPIWYLYIPTSHLSKIPFHKNWLDLAAKTPIKHFHPVPCSDFKLCLALLGIM